MAYANTNSSHDADPATSEKALFFDLSPDLLAIADFKGHFKHTNPAWTRVFGYTEAELLACPFLELVHPEDRCATLAKLEGSKTGISSFNFENRFLAKDGSYRYLAWSASSQPERGELYCIARDVTQQKELEYALYEANATLERRIVSRTLALEQASQNLYESEVLFRTALDHVPDVFVIYDAQRRMQFVNAAGLALSNHSLEDFLGHTDEEMFPPDVTSAYLPLLLQTVETKQYQTGECTINLPGHEPYTIVVQYVPLLDDLGELQQILGITHDITERKKTEAALARSEAFRRAVTDVVPAAIFVYDLNADCMVFCNPAYETLLGYSLDEIKAMGANFLPTIYHPDSRDFMLCQAHQRRKDTSGQVFEQEYKLCCKDGSTRTGLSRELVLTRNADGTAAQILGIALDISDHKRAEAERWANVQMRRELRLLEDIFDLILAGYWDWDICGNQEYYSAGFKRMLGYDEHELSNQPETWQRLIFPEDLPEVRACLERHIRSHGQEPFYKEVRYHHKDGSTVWVICSGQIIEWDAAGQPLRMIGCHVNISDRKAAEMQLKASEEKFRNYVENANSIIYTLSFEGVFTYASPSLTNLLGYELHEVIGQSFVPLVHPEDQDKCLDFLRLILSGGAIHQGPEYRVRHKNGTWRWHTSQGAPQWDKDGRIVAYLGVGYDITDRKQAEANLRQANQTLERATRLKDEFLANMSHELRTPLNAILGMSEGLQEQVFGPLNERQLQALNTIETSGTHLLELINDILDLSKIEAGHMELSLTPTDVPQLCRSSLAFVKQQAYKKRLQLRLALPSQVPPIPMDERRIRQVLINLLTNAVKFTPEGGYVTLAVSLCATSARGIETPYMRMSVTDTGIGIAPADQGKLFQPFTQIDSALNRKYEGTGLGLALVKHIVELHGGRVAVISDVDAGSCFIVDLPYTVSPPPPSSVHPRFVELSPGNDFAPTAETTAPLILLAEDNEANIATISSYLEAKGYRVSPARNGQEAISLANQETPALILMDIQMPEINGLEATQTIRQIPHLAEVPIIALTALAMTGDCDRCLAAGATAYLSKPVKLKQLMTTIQDFLPENQPG